MSVRLRSTLKANLDFVLSAESHPDNSPFVSQWTRKQHEEALADADIAHFIIKRDADEVAVGYLLLAGLENPHRNLELRRIVITDKGKGYGREALRSIKKLAFEKFHAHRLWLDVKDHNQRAQQLYEAEGFVREGLLRECIKMGDRFESLILMSMLENEYYATSTESSSQKRFGV
jgi:RimJ/RimL family protein N-acetyltransferase